MLRVYMEREKGWVVSNVRALHDSAGEHIAVLEGRDSPRVGRVSIISRGRDSDSQPRHFTFDITGGVRVSHGINFGESSPVPTKAHPRKPATGQQAESEIELPFSVPESIG